LAQSSQINTSIKTNEYKGGNGDIQYSIYLKSLKVVAEEFAACSFLEEQKKSIKNCLRN